MTDNKIYRSANGQKIDMGQLALKNEKVRAVGNMNVNARGDVIDNSNKATASRSAQVNKTYRKQTGNIVQDLPAGSSKPAADEEIVGLDKTVEEPAAAEVKTGLAGAIAKTKKNSK